MPATKSISVKSVEAEAPRLGWRFARLDSVCQIRHGGPPSRDVPEYWRGSLPWASPKDMWVDLVENTQDHISEEAVRQSATNIAGEDSLLVVIRSGILARRFPVAMAATRLAYNQDIKALLPDRAAIDKKIQEVAQEEAALMRSSINTRLNARAILTAEQRAKLVQFMQNRMRAERPQAEGGMPPGRPASKAGQER